MPSAMKPALIVFLSSLCINLNNADQLPSFINRCSLNSTTEELGKCLIKSSREVLMQLTRKEGIPELKLPSISPIDVGNVEIQNGKGESGMHIAMSDMKVWGLENIESSKFLMDFDKKIFEVTITMSNITVLTNYHMKGKLLLFELNAAGAARMHMGALDIDAKSKFDIKKRNGKSYIALKDLQNTRKTKDLYLDFGDIFPGNKMLSEQVTKVVNENIAILEKDFSPLVYQSLTLFDKLLSTVFNDYSIDELFVVK